MSELNKLIRDVMVEPYRTVQSCGECWQVYRATELIDGLCWVCWSLQALKQHEDRDG